VLERACSDRDQTARRELNRHRRRRKTRD